MQKLILIITTLLITSFNSMAQNNGIDVISVAIKSGNAKEISKHFDSSISLKILNKEDVYSKAQAEIIIKDFIMKNPIKNYISTERRAVDYLEDHEPVLQYPLTLI